MFGQFNIWVGWFEIKKDNIRSVQARWPYSIRQLTIELMNSLKEFQSIIYPKRVNKKPRKNRHLFVIQRLRRPTKRQKKTLIKEKNKIVFMQMHGFCCIKPRTLGKSVNWKRIGT